MNKKALITVLCVVVVSVVVITMAIRPKVNRQSVQNETKTVTTQSGEVVNKPRFMYFVSQADIEDTKVKEAIEKLQLEYGQNVIFEIKNIDEDKSLLDNFPIVKDNTPALIMLKSDGDISTFLFKTSEYDKLKEAIETEVK